MDSHIDKRLQYGAWYISKDRLNETIVVLTPLSNF